MKISIFMMCRDEENLVEQWLRYHGDIFGYDNIYIFDNGSSDNTKGILKSFEERGVHIDFSKQGRKAFDDKGSIFEGIIKQMDIDNPSDFYFPLDCDEFICVEKEDGTFSSNREDIFLYLNTIKYKKETFMIGGGIDNNPYAPGFFRLSLGQRKCFFGKNNCAYLDHGFHIGRSVHSADTIKTKIFYFHFHYRPYDIMIRSSINKIGEDFTNRTRSQIYEYMDSGLPGFHVAENFLIKELNYKIGFIKNKYIYIRSIIDYMVENNIKYPFYEYAITDSEKTLLLKEFNSLPLPWSYGFIDLINEKDGIFVISGWCLTRDLKVPVDFSIWIGTVEIQNFQVKKVARPDVVHEHPGAEEMCGLVIEIPIFYLQEINAHGKIRISPKPEKVFLQNYHSFSFSKSLTEN